MRLDQENPSDVRNVGIELCTSKEQVEVSLNYLFKSGSIRSPIIDLELFDLGF